MMSNHLWLGTVRPIGAALLGLCGIAGTMSAAAEKATADPEAYRLMTRAVEARAVWGEAFPGFDADIEINYEGQVHRGKVRVLADGRVELTDLSPPQRQAESWAQGWLSEMVFHRLGAQESDDRYREIRMVGEENHPLGPMLAMDDPFNSSFRVDGKVIRQVNRDLQADGANEDGAERVRINVLDAAFTPDGKVLPMHFVINYVDNEEQLVAVEAVSSRFRRLNGYELPQWRRVITTADGEMTAAVMTLSNHRLKQDSQRTAGDASRE